MKLHFNNRRGLRPPASSPRSDRRSAFTMVEIAIALGVIGFALVAIIGILPAGLEVQRDNRTETIINQDATFWLEAIRNGARGLEGLTNQIDRIEITGPSRSDKFDNFPGGNAQIIGLLTTQAREPDMDVRAYVWSVSGAVAEKEPNKTDRVIAFKYRMTVHIDRATNFARPFTDYSGNNEPGLAPEPLDSLYQVSLTFSYPLSPVDDTKPTSRRQSYRTLVSRQITTNNIGGRPYYFFAE